MVTDEPESKNDTTNFANEGLIPIKFDFFDVILKIICFLKEFYTRTFFEHPQFMDILLDQKIIGILPRFIIILDSSMEEAC